MGKSSIFTSVPVQRPKTNTFNLSHSHETTIEAGYLVPVLCDEILPGDSIKYNTNVLVRLQPMLAPIYHKMDISVMTFFCPDRLLWKNPQAFEKFMSSSIPDLETPVAPYFNPSAAGMGDTFANLGSLANYLGIPAPEVYNPTTGELFYQWTEFDTDINALPWAAYQKICNDYFRDENLSNIVAGKPKEFDYLLDEGLNDINKFEILRKRAWQHDYFTSCLPFAQKGAPVVLPIGELVDVPLKYNGTDGNQFYIENLINETDNPVPTSFDRGSAKGPLVDSETLYASTSEMSDETIGVNINQLRWATALQKFLEKNARGGTRYIEMVGQHFDVRSSDKRLQRAEFLGSTSNPIIISEVLQTSDSTEEATPQGNMSGHGISFGGTRHIKYFAEEHGFLMTLVCIRPKTKYAQGLDRMFTRLTNLDRAYPTFAHLGEQEVKRQELYYSNNNQTNNETFGYLPRYAEYKYKQDRTSGDFVGNLAYWTMTRFFNAPPLLNEAFVFSDPTKRIFAANVLAERPYLVSINHHYFNNRRLPKWGIPSL